MSRNLKRMMALGLLFSMLCMEVSPAAAEEAAETAWMKTAVFPDWKGYTDDTLAMNSMISFHGWHGQGRLRLDISEETESFRLYVNGQKVETDGMAAGTREMDISGLTVNGTNTLQVSNILPEGIRDAVTVSIGYPAVLPGDPAEEGIHPLALELISDLIQSDIDHGFTSAQLAVVRNGRMVYENAWGRINILAS